MCKINSTKEKIKILKKVLRLLKAGKETYICYAIGTATKHHWSPEVSEIKSYISNALKHFCYFHNWLARYRPKYKGTAHDARILWVKWMIACYEEDLQKLQARK